MKPGVNCQAKRQIKKTWKITSLLYLPVELQNKKAESISLIFISKQKKWDKRCILMTSSLNQSCHRVHIYKFKKYMKTLLAKKT